MHKIAPIMLCLLAAALLAFYVWQYTSPFPLDVPKDRSLVALFHAHQQAFQTLADMADKDATIASTEKSENLGVARRSEYARLVSQIDRKMKLGFGDCRIAFWFARGGILLSIGPRWAKGIACLTCVPSRVGEIVSNLDKDPGRGGGYLVPIEGDWYMIYQRLDYDDWRKKKL